MSNKCPKDHFATPGQKSFRGAVLFDPHVPDPVHGEKEYPGSHAGMPEAAVSVHDLLKLLFPRALPETVQRFPAEFSRAIRAAGSPGSLSGGRRAVSPVLHTFFSPASSVIS